MSRKDPFDITPRFEQPPVRAVFVSGGINLMRKELSKMAKLNRPSGRNDTRVKAALDEVFETAFNLVQMWSYDPSRDSSGIRRKPESAD